MSVNDTLGSRQSDYGEFIDNASIAQDLKDVIHNTANWNSMPADMKEALEMIASKMSRLLNGDMNHIDSWHDISGYATLVENRLRGKANEDAKNKQVQEG